LFLKNQLIRMIAISDWSERVKRTETEMGNGNADG